KQGGSITFFSSSEPTNMDPATCVPYGAASAIWCISIYDNLINVEYGSGKIIPRIAESVTSNADSTVWTVKLRKGVTFTDGTPYNAAAVITNWDRFKDP